ncbi:MAG: hypothetical protein V8Q21_07380 [Akkermansia muciniphila]
MLPSPEQFKCPGCGAPFSAADTDDRRETVTCGNCGTSTELPFPAPEPGFPLPGIWR